MPINRNLPTGIRIRRAFRPLLPRTGRRAAALLAAAAALLLAADAPAQQVLSLDEALQLADRSNLTVRRSANDLEIARNNNTAGNAGLLPQLDLTAGYTGALNNARQTFTSGDVVNRSNASSTNVTSGLALTWTVFDGFRNTTQRERLDQIEDLAVEDFRASQELLSAQVIRAYYDIVQQQRVLTVAREAVALSQGRHENVELKYQVGEASKRDLLQARVDLNADRSSVLRQEATLDNAKTTLNVLLGRQAGTEFAVTDTIVVATDLDLEALRADALRDNSSVRAARAGTGLAELDLATARADRYPRVGATLGYNFLLADAQTGQILNNRTNGLAYGITASMNLFDGFNTSRESENARLAIASSELQLDETQQQVEGDLAKAFRNYRNRLEVMTLEEENVGIARENLDLAFERYRVGTLIPVELREAQNAYVAAEGRLVNARYEAKLAETELLRLSGRLKRSEK